MSLNKICINWTEVPNVGDCIFHYFAHGSNERPMDAQMRYFGEVLLDKPGFGTRCMVDEPLE